MAICKHCHDNVILIFNFAAFERKGNAKYLNKRPMRIIWVFLKTVVIISEYALRYETWNFYLAVITMDVPERNYR